jgi:RNA polymerase sigma-70 factor, ECF subfamily
MSFVPHFQAELLALIPVMRACATLMTANRADADDLVQDAVERAWRAQHQYEPGTNMKAWVLTILRNSHHNRWRRGRMFVEDVDGRDAAALVSEANQHWRMEFADVLAAVDTLDLESRHALLLITAGLSYEEAADICGAPLRTVQSRVRRARERLAELLLDRPQPLV